MKSHKHLCEDIALCVHLTVIIITMIIIIIIIIMDFSPVNGPACVPVTVW